MLESNPHWEGKAEIVALSLDDTPEDAAKRISEKGWDKVKSYFLQNDFQSEAAKRFNIEGIPSCFLV